MFYNIFSYLRTSKFLDRSWVDPKSAHCTVLREIKNMMASTSNILLYWIYNTDFCFCLTIKLNLYVFTDLELVKNKGGSGTAIIKKNYSMEAPHPQRGTFFLFYFTTIRNYGVLFFSFYMIIQIYMQFSIILLMILSRMAPFKILIYVRIFLVYPYPHR